MRLIRFSDAGREAWGRLLDDDTAVVCDGTPFAGLRDTGRQLDSTELTLLPPVAAGKILGVGLNYRDHAAEHHQALPEEPLLFHKPPSALIADGEVIELHDPANHNDEEIELVAVIGRRTRRVSTSDALDHVLGFTVGNDVTDRDIQHADRSWMARAKGYDTYAPVGPVIQTELDPRALTMTARINGETVQSGTTADMVFGVAELVSFASHVCTLEPGDLIFTGTPSGVSRIVPGDRVELEIEGVGRLANPVAAAAARA